jgi:hypothetical protein
VQINEYWGLLLAATPSPSPTGTTSGGGLADFWDTKAIIAGIVSSLVLSLFSDKARGFYMRLGRKVLRLGPWVADKWKRLRTPLDQRGPAPASAPAKLTIRSTSFGDRQIGVPTQEEIEEDEAYNENRAEVRRIVSGSEQTIMNIETLRKHANAGSLRDAVKTSRPPLPASWQIVPDWDRLGSISLENVGPGDASHVLIQSGMKEAVVRKGYWDNFPVGAVNEFIVDPGEWLTAEGFHLVLTWHDEEDQERSALLDIPTGFVY